MNEQLTFEIEQRPTIKGFPISAKYNSGIATTSSKI